MPEPPAESKSTKKTPPEESKGPALVPQTKPAEEIDTDDNDEEMDDKDDDEKHEPTPEEL